MELAGGLAGPSERPRQETGPVAPLWRNIPTLRGLAICLVVANHAIQATGSLFASAHPAIVPQERPGAFLTVLLMRSLTPVCLVAFFFTSGFMAFRLFGDAKASRAATAQLLRKYLIWSVAMLALFSLGQRGLDWRRAARAVLIGEAQPAYWFLIVLLVLMAATPPLIRLVRSAPWSGLVAAAGLQLAACADFYLVLLDGRPRTAWEVAALRPLQFLPAFLAGMWVSRNAERVQGWLRARRALLVRFTVVAALACVAEAWGIWSAAGYRLGGTQPMFATERASLAAFAFGAVLLLVTTGVRGARLGEWLKRAGGASLGIMLLMDACMRPLLVGVWQLPARVSASAAEALAHHRLPAGLAERTLWLTVIFFAVGMWGPLRIMEWGRRLLGNRVRYLW